MTMTVAVVIEDFGVEEFGSQILGDAGTHGFGFGFGFGFGGVFGGSDLRMVCEGWLLMVQVDEGIE